LALAKVQGPPGGGEEKVFLIFANADPLKDYCDYIDHYSESGSSRKCSVLERFRLLSFYFVIYSQTKVESPKSLKSEGELPGKRLLERIFDLAIIGGGVNGCGIARDAAGRGNSVFL